MNILMAFLNEPKLFFNEEISTGLSLYDFIHDLHLFVELLKALDKEVVFNFVAIDSDNSPCTDYHYQRSQHLFPLGCTRLQHRFKILTDMRLCI